MFERNKGKQSTLPQDNFPTSSQTPSAASASGSVNARKTAMIGSSITIKGTISGEEDLLIQGKVEGAITLKDHEVSIGESGRITADVTAKTIRIDGEVTGDITGSEKVILSKSGNVRGNIVAPRVTLEDGAIFKGSIDMDPGDTASNSVSLASEKKPEKVVDSNSVGNHAPQLDLKSG
jgi:cytoskeletal protein CcmA (bactofilin family)